MQSQAHVKHLTDSLEETQNLSTSRVSALTIELSLALKNNNFLQQEKLALKQSLASQRARTVKAEDTVAALCAEKEKEPSYQQSIKDLEGRNKILQQSLENEKKKVLKANMEHNTDLASVQQSLKDKTASLSEMQGSVDWSQKRIAELENMLSESQRELREHKEEASTTESQSRSSMNKLRNEVVTMRIALAEAESKAASSRTSVRHAEQQTDATARESKQWQPQAQSSESQAEKEEDGLGGLTDHYDALILQHRKLSLEYDELLEAYQLLQDRHSDILNNQNGDHIDIDDENYEYQSKLQAAIKYHQYRKQIVIKLVVRWQRFFADLVYVFFRQSGESFNLKRLRTIMRDHGIDREVAKEISVRAEQWEPFVRTALQDRCTDDIYAWDMKLSHTLPESSAEASEEIEEAQRLGNEL